MSIVVRPAGEADCAAMKLLPSLPYEAPEWEKMDASAIVERDGVISAAVFLRRTAETYLVLNPVVDLRKRERLGELLMLHKELVAPAARAGFTDIHCWLPPELEERHFGRLLLHLGWEKPLWPCYSKKVKP